MPRVHVHDSKWTLGWGKRRGGSVSLVPLVKKTCARVFVPQVLSFVLAGARERAESHGTRIAVQAVDVSGQVPRGCGDADCPL